MNLERRFSNFFSFSIFSLRNRNPIPIFVKLFKVSLISLFNVKEYLASVMGELEIWIVLYLGDLSFRSLFESRVYCFSLSSLLLCLFPLCSSYFKILVNYFWSIVMLWNEINLFFTTLIFCISENRGETAKVIWFFISL